MLNLTVNGVRHTVDADPEMPLLWALRDHLDKTGTKYGCGIAQCGACTVHLDGQPVRSCQTKIGDVGEAKITTIEGISVTVDWSKQRWNLDAATATFSADCRPNLPPVP